MRRLIVCVRSSTNSPDSRIECGYREFEASDDDSQQTWEEQCTHRWWRCSNRCCQSLGKLWWRRHCRGWSSTGDHRSGNSLSSHCKSPRRSWRASSSNRWCPCCPRCRRCRGCPPWSLSDWFSSRWGCVPRSSSPAQERNGLERKEKKKNKKNRHSITLLNPFLNPNYTLICHTTITFQGPP